jgi:hypothetical protein
MTTSSGGLCVERLWVDAGQAGIGGGLESGLRGDP